MEEKEVYFASIKEVNGKNNFLIRLEDTFEKAFQGEIKDGQRVLIKTHFGQYGNLRYLRPSIVYKVVEIVKSKGAEAVVAESCGLGFGAGGLYGGRTTMSNYITMAAKNGYTYGTIGAPIIMLDGEYGADTIEYQLNGEYVKKVAIARGMLGFDKIIILTHAKGHGIAGLGGAIKNLGIGCVGKYSKAVGHTEMDLRVNEEKCQAETCGQPCVRYCPTLAIKVNPEKQKAEIDYSKCIYCLHCMSVCNRMANVKAIEITWTPSHDVQSKKFAENALGVVKGVGEEKFLYVNILIDVTENCDCVSFTGRTIVPDIGVLSSRDPVAIDQACLDLINAEPGIPGTKSENMKPGEDKLAHIYEVEDKKLKVHTSHISMLEHAEKIGLGSRKYKLTEIPLRS